MTEYGTIIVDNISEIKEEKKKMQPLSASELANAYTMLGYLQRQEKRGLSFTPSRTKKRENRKRSERSRLVNRQSGNHS